MVQITTQVLERKAKKWKKKKKRHFSIQYMHVYGEGPTQKKKRQNMREK